MPQPGDLIGAIDAGSNAIRLSIFNLNKRLDPFPHFRKRYPVRLGAGTFSTGALSPADMDAAVEAFREIASIAREHSVIALPAVATSAIREASNREEFLARIKTETDIELRPITGSEEARLAALGVGMPPKSKRNTVIIDIGGGSTEVAVFNPAGEILWDRSLPIGAVRLAEEWGISKYYDLEECRYNRYKIREVLLTHLPETKLTKERAFALGGSPGALLEMATNIQYELLKPDVLDSRSLAHFVAKLIITEIQSMPHDLGIDRRRAPILLPGAEILKEIMLHLAIDQIRVSDSGVQEGLAKDYILKQR